MKLIILLITFLLVIQHVSCSCNIPSYLQIPCSNYELTEKMCLEAGCCYNENEVDVRKCFQKSRNKGSYGMFDFNPTIIPKSDTERLAEIEPGLKYYPEYMSEALLGIRRVGLSKVRLVCHATDKCPQNTPYRYPNTKSSCYRQGCCYNYQDGECYKNLWIFLKLCPPGSFCKEHCEKKNLCNTGTCVAQANSPGFTCTCPYGVCGDNCERTDDCFKFFVTTGVHQPFDGSKSLCEAGGTQGRVASRILTSEGSSYHAQITATLTAAAVDKYFLGIKGDSAKSQYLLTETDGDAESGLLFSWTGGSAPDYPTSGEVCVIYDKSTGKMVSEACGQENYALCQYSNA